MQVIPNVVLEGATGSERQVLKLLRGVDWGGGKARALNSLNLANHLYQRWGEIDFLVVGPKGVVAIEVKGGDVSCGEDGRWRYEDRLGRVVTRSKSPLVQVKDAFFSLDKNYLSPEFGPTFTRRAPCGFCVVLAGMARTDVAGLLGGPEFPAELFGTREDVANTKALQQFLERVVRYWSEKNNFESRIQDGVVARLVQLLRPEFERVQPLAVARGRFDQEMLALTEEQYGVLDLWEGADRILCSAPAGCGKTLLAVEMARRARQAHEHVVFVVGASTLASSLRDSSALGDTIVAHEEARRLVDSGVPKAARLIIDEGQQFLTRDGIELLDRLVEGGIEGGKWAWFGDANYQLRNPNPEAVESMARLFGAAAVRPHLSKNCRNTPEIITSVELASGAPLGHAIVRGRGQAPTMVAIADRDRAAVAIARQVASWVAEGTTLADITLLADADTDLPVLIRDIAAAGGFPMRPWDSNERAPPAVGYSTIESFRGLESEFLLINLAGNWPVEGALARTLYLSMTRGNFAVALFARSGVLDAIRACMEANVGRFLAEAANG